MTHQPHAEPIPVPDLGAQYWGEIDVFALTYNGDDRHGGSDGAAAINSDVRSQWDNDAALPDELEPLRCALFFEQRRWRHLDAHPRGDDLVFIEALIDRIRALSGGTVPGVDSSTARIRPGSERRGNPVVKGDIVVNPVYDPKKVYRFVVFGNFDPKGLGHPTESGAAEIETMITNWGGQVATELMGDVDFLVMGPRPVLPSAPRPGSPIAVVQEYNRQYAKAQRYDDLIKQAQATSLPVLNANRLFTLIGR